MGSESGKRREGRTKRTNGRSGETSSKKKREERHGNGQSILQTEGMACVLREMKTERTYENVIIKGAGNGSGSKKDDV